MSHSTLTEPITPVESPPMGSGNTSTLVANAREIIAGRVVPTIEPDAAIDAWLADQFKDREPPPLATAIENIRTQLYLEKRYSDRMVAWFRLPNNGIFVLAAGNEEVRELFAGLTDEEKSKVVIDSTHLAAAW